MIYYHRGVSGRIRFVKLNRVKNSVTTAEPLPMVFDNSVRPASELKGKWIELNGYRGRIIRPLSACPRFLKGKYVGQKRWLSRRDMAQFNHFVVVKWRKHKTCPHSTRQPLFKLKFV